MRLKEFFYLLGLKPSARIFGHTVRSFDLPKEGRIEFAQWRNPRAPAYVPEQEEIDELRKFLRDGDLAIDVGAQVGDSTLPIALACGGAGAVMAFEPNPFTFTILGANAVLNPGRANILPFPYAATAEDGPLTFEYGNPAYDNGGDHAGISRWRHGSAFVLPVEGRRIEPIIRARFAGRLDRLRYIKTDVESHDFAVLKTLEPLIDECRPHVKSEINKYTPIDEREAMFGFLKAKGYRLHLVDGTKLFGPELTDSDTRRAKTFDIFAVPESR